MSKYDEKLSELLHKTHATLTELDLPVTNVAMLFDWNAEKVRADGLDPESLPGGLLGSCTELRISGIRNIQRQAANFIVSTTDMALNAIARGINSDADENEAKQS